MKKSTRIVKKLLALFLVVLMSINTMGAVVSDNDGSAFITKAEFDSLKNNFQAQIDQYNTSIDSKIDGAISGYLAGINMAKTESINILTNNWKEYTIKNGSLANDWALPDLDMQVSIMLTHEDNQGVKNQGYKKCLWGVGTLKRTATQPRTNRRNIVSGITLSGTNTVSGVAIWKGQATNYVEKYTASQIRTSGQGMNPSYMDDRQTGEANKIWVCQALAMTQVGEITSATMNSVWTPTFLWTYYNGQATTTVPTDSSSWNPSTYASSVTTNVSYMTNSAGNSFIYEHIGTWFYNTEWEISADAQTKYIRNTASDTNRSDTLLSNSVSGGTWSGNEWHAVNGYAAFKKNQSFAWRDNKNNSLTGNTNKSMIPHIGLVPVKYKSENIYQYDEGDIIDPDGSTVPKITMEQGLPLMKVKEDEIIEWAPEWKNITVPETTTNTELVLVLSYKPFSNGRMTYYGTDTQDINDYVKFDGLDRGYFPITTDRKLKIKFEAEKEGYIYAKWFPNIQDADIESKAWEATLDISKCSTYKSTKSN